MDEAGIRHIAKLARLTLDESLISRYAENMTDLLAFVDKLQAIDTSQVAPLFHPLELKQRLREDQATEENQRETLQAMAPEVERGLYLVPKVIDREA